MIKLDHLTISVGDYRKSRDWYIQHLGLKLEFEVPDRAAALIDDSGFTLFLEQAIETPSPCCVLYFQVDNVDEKHRRLSETQVPFVHPPEKRFWGYGVELKDPDGYCLRLWDQKSMQENDGD
ncbi:MAG TPA: VOC family protein [Blastocatellia bacterium]|nr:VOC family protein [Blastocatellia bacterium]